MVNSGSHKGNLKHDCYTCNKNQYIKRFVLLQTDLYEIHASMNKYKKRLTVTPIVHVSDISELGSYKFMNIYLGIKQFLHQYNVPGFELSIKTGDWMRHDHQHTHILIEDQYLDQILKDHNIHQDVDNPNDMKKYKFGRNPSLKATGVDENWRDLNIN